MKNVAKLPQLDSRATLLPFDGVLSKIYCLCRDNYQLLEKDDFHISIAQRRIGGKTCNHVTRIECEDDFYFVFNEPDETGFATCSHFQESLYDLRITRKGEKGRNNPIFDLRVCRQIPLWDDLWFGGYEQIDRIHRFRKGPNRHAKKHDGPRDYLCYVNGKKKDKNGIPTQLVCSDHRGTEYLPAEGEKQAYDTEWLFEELDYGLKHILKYLEEYISRHNSNDQIAR